MTIKLPVAPLIPTSMDGLRKFTIDRYYYDKNFIMATMAKVEEGDTLYIKGTGQDGSGLRYLDDVPYEVNEAMRLLDENFCYNLSLINSMMGLQYAPMPQIVEPITFMPTPYSQIDYSLPEYQHAFNDMGVAQMVAAVLNGNLFFVPEERAFYKWDEKIWRKCYDMEVEGIIASICKCQLEQMSGKEGFDDKRAVYNGNMKSIRGIKEALAILLSIRRCEAFMDNLPLLCVRNGVIDFSIPGFELRKPTPHELYKHLHLTQMIDIDFIPGITNCTWDRFIIDIMNGDIELTTYIQRTFGYALIGTPKEQKFFMLYGSGSNGKTTLLCALQSVLGREFCCNTSPNMFMGSDTIGTNAPRPEMLQLIGKRMVFSSELPKDAPLSEARLKRLVAGGRIFARGLYSKDIIEFVPEYTIFVDTNHLPNLSESDYAIERRIGIIPFLRTFQRWERDVDLDKKINSCPEAVLAWLVNGAAMYMQRGLIEPKISKQIIRSYIDSQKCQPVTNDDIAIFLRDCIETKPNVAISSEELYRAYETYCILRNIAPKSKDAFSKRLPDEIKTRKHHSNKGQRFEGISLKAQYSV